MVLDRRGFLKFVTGASVGIMATPLPWKLLDDVSIWSQNWSWIPHLQYGTDAYINVVSKTCPSAVAMKVRTVNNRPVRVLPRPEHPLGGGISSIAAAEVQMLFSPGRVRKPLLRGPDGGFKEITWPQAGELFFNKIKAAKADVAFLSGDETGSTVEVLSAFAAKLGSKQVFLMPSEAQAAAKAAELMGIEAQLGYDFEQSDYILAVGANILETWGTAIRNRRVYAKATPHPTEGSKQSVTIAYAGPLQNNTAAVAKPWLGIAAGSECALLLGICNELIKRGRSINATDFTSFKALAAKYTLEATAKETGLTADAIKQTVTALLNAKHPLVVTASEGNGAVPIILGVAVNALLGNINDAGGLTLLADAPIVINGAKSRREIFANDALAFLLGNNLPQVLVLHEANPLYALPSQAALKDSLSKIPFTVSFSTMMDETAMQCDLVLPIPMGLESVDDIYNPYGCGKNTFCVTLRASEPMANVLGAANSMLFMAKQLGMPLGYDDFGNVVKAKAEALGAGFADLGHGQAYQNDNTVSMHSLNLNTTAIQKAMEAGAEGKGLTLAMYSKLNFGTAKTGIPPFNTKTIRAQELVGKEMYVMLNGATAKAQNVANNDLVTLTAGKKSIKARVRVFEGLAPNAVAVSKGFGHSALDAFSQNKGANIMELLTAVTEPETGLCAWSSARVEVTKA